MGKVLIACEYSGTVRDAFLRAGHHAVSCDLLGADNGGPHYQGDMFDITGNGWDLIIAHPPCTFLTSSGLHWNKRIPERAQQTEDALEFVRRIMALDCPRIAIENPVGCIGTRIRPADQYIQPYEYGHDASKRTGLWLKGLPLLIADPADYVEPRMIDGKPRWANQTDSGQNRLPPTPDRWKIRSTFYRGWADAMATQWGPLLDETTNTNEEAA